MNRTLISELAIQGVVLAQRVVRSHAKRAGGDHRFPIPIISFLQNRAESRDVEDAEELHTNDDAKKAEIRGLEQRMITGLMAAVYRSANAKGGIAVARAASVVGVSEYSMTRYGLREEGADGIPAATLLRHVKWNKPVVQEALPYAAAFAAPFDNSWEWPTGGESLIR